MSNELKKTNHHTMSGLLSKKFTTWSKNSYFKFLFPIMGGIAIGFFSALIMKFMS